MTALALSTSPVAVAEAVLGPGGEAGLGPGVLGRGPAAEAALYGDVVDSPRQAEESLLAPVGAPGVPDDPVLLPVLLTVAHHRDVVVDLD